MIYLKYVIALGRVYTAAIETKSNVLDAPLVPANVQSYLLVLGHVLFIKEHH